MKHFSLFSGIESFKKAMTNLGIENELVGFSEFDEYASVALAAIHGIDESLNFGDITKIDETKVPDCDLITYGFPCQDISIAGHQKGIVEGETRSGLLYDALRIIKYKMPKYAIAENVKALVSKKFKPDFEKLLNELDEMGYNNYWKVLNAKDYGIPQNRERVFIVSIRKDVDDGKFEFPIGFDNGLRLKDFLEDEVEDKYYVENERTQNLISQLKEELEKPCIVASRGRNPNNPSYRTVGSPTEQRLEPNSQGITNTLTTVQKDNLVLEPNELIFVGGIGEKDWVGDSKKHSRNYPQGNRVYDIDGIACSQTANGGGIGGATGLYLEETNEPKRLGGLFDNGEKKHQAGAVWDKEQLCPTIDTCQGGHREPLIIEDSPQVAVREATKQGYAIATVGDSINLEQPNSKTRRGRVGKEVAQTLTTSCNQATLVYDPYNLSLPKDQEAITTLRTNYSNGNAQIIKDYRIRKLTPKECWRLMGFDDEDYFKAKQALNDTFYKGNDRSNSQMYKMAGNSIVVDVLEHILHNLLIGGRR